MLRNRCLTYMGSVALITTALVLFHSPALADSSGSGAAGDRCEGYAKCVIYDHARQQFTTSRQLELRDGEYFALVITNTAPEFFTYPLEGFERRFVTRDEAARGYTALSDKTIPIQHEKKYAGYRFSIRSIDNDLVLPEDPTLPILRNTPEPQDILVETIQWHQSLAGAFTMSTLTDPEFSVYSRKASDGNDLMFLEEDSGAKDEAALGLGAFLHLYHSSWDTSAISFGLGLDSDQDPTYFLGYSYRFGDKGAVTAGVALGPVARTPNGVRTCGRGAGACADSLAVDANVLSQLGSKTDWGAFVSLSYSFLDVAGLFEKPFKQLSGGASPTVETDKTPQMPKAKDEEDPPAGGDQSGREETGGGESAGGD